MTSYGAICEKYRILSTQRGPKSVESRVCAALVRAVHDSLASYCRRTQRLFSNVLNYACEVDLSGRQYKVTVYPYVYTHTLPYEILDGLDVSYHSKFKDEKEQ